MKIFSWTGGLLIILLSTFSVGFFVQAHGAVSPQSNVAVLNYQYSTSTMLCKTLRVEVYGGALNSENLCAGMSASIAKDNLETDPNHDYYAIDFQVWTFNGSSTCAFPAWGCLPPAPGIMYSSSLESITVPGGFSLLQVQPQAASSSSDTQTQVNMQFCAQGDVAGACLGFTLLGPSHSISTSQSVGGPSTIANWSVTMNSLDTCCHTVQGSESDYGVLGDVQEGQSFTASFSATPVFHYTGCPENWTPGTTCFVGYQDVPFTVSGSLFAPDPDFSLSGPTSVPITACQTTTTTIMAASQPNFQGIVYFSDTPPSGFTTSFSPTSVNIGGGTSASTTYSFTAPCNISGKYEWTVTGYTTGGTSLQHTLIICTQSPCGDYSIAAIPNNIGLQQGGPSGSTQISLSSLNGFTGSVSLSAVSQLSLSWQASNTISVPGTAVLYVQANSNAQIITYTVTVTGTSSGNANGITHSVTLYVTVTSPTNGGGCKCTKT